MTTQTGSRALRVGDKVHLRGMERTATVMELQTFPDASRREMATLDRDLSMARRASRTWATADLVRVFCSCSTASQFVGRHHHKDCARYGRDAPNRPLAEGLHTLNRSVADHRDYRMPEECAAALLADRERFLAWGRKTLRAVSGNGDGGVNWSELRELVGDSK